MYKNAFIRRCGFTLVSLCFSALLGADQSRQLKWEDLHPDMILGSLGQSLGTYITIDGTMPDRAMMLSNPFSVDTVNGKELKDPIIIELHGIDNLKSKVRYHFRGYESGGMNGSPGDPEDHSGLSHQQPFSFVVWFEVIAPAAR
jgi:hypothetical protein